MSALNEAANLPDFEYLAEVLKQNPSEIHGMLCAMLCADETLDETTWLARISPELGEDCPCTAEAEALLQELFAISASQLHDENLSFYLLLPADEYPLSQRAYALACWCQGFLAGLGLGGMVNGQLAAPVQEFLSDLVDIARLDSDSSGNSKEDEEYYMEIVEYVRMGVLLVSLELHSQSSLTTSSQVH